jgi:hypothetical protein
MPQGTQQSQAAKSQYLQRVKCTRNDFLPERSSSGSKVFRIAHARAARPKPLPGSKTTRTPSTYPAGLTRTSITGIASFVCSISASGGNWQFQSVPPCNRIDLETSTGGADVGTAGGGPTTNRSPKGNGTLEGGFSTARCPHREGAQCLGAPPAPRSQLARPHAKLRGPRR